MNNTSDSKAWKAAKKAGLLIHKVRGIAAGEDYRSLFIVFVQEANGDISHFRRLFTAEEVIKEAQRDTHDTFFMGDLFEGFWEAAKTEPRRIDVPCVSMGL